MNTETEAPPIAVAAQLFRGLGDPTRLAILLALTEGERRVVDLMHEVGTSQPNISGHLACLKDCGLVVDRPEGRQMFYRIADEEIYGFLVASERLLATAGHAIELCPNYRRTEAADPSPVAEP